MIFDILDEPVDDTYRMLLAGCFKYCTSAILVVRDENNLSSTAVNALTELESSCLGKGKRSEWPGTIMRHFQATVYEYRLVPTVLLTLQTTANGLYQWVQPCLPEDLSLLRRDGTPLLVSIGHERDSYLEMTEEEADELMLHVPRLKLAKRT